jgi:hypothetical protein
VEKEFRAIELGAVNMKQIHLAPRPQKLKIRIN